MATLSDGDRELVEDLVVANHILFDQGVVDAFGHVSVRHDKHNDRYLLARDMAPAEVTGDDIIEFDLDSVAQPRARRRIGAIAWLGADRADARARFDRCRRELAACGLSRGVRGDQRAPAIRKMRFGEPVVYLTPDEATATFKNIETQIKRPWDLWKKRVSRGP